MAVEVNISFEDDDDNDGEGSLDPSQTYDTSFDVDSFDNSPTGSAATPPPPSATTSTPPVSAANSAPSAATANTPTATASTAPPASQAASPTSPGMGGFGGGNNRNGPPATPPPNPGGQGPGGNRPPPLTQQNFPSQTAVQKAINAEIARQKAELAREKKQLRKELKRDHQDETEDRRIQRQYDKVEATARRQEIRSTASALRTQAYSSAAALGLPGYVAATIFDVFFLRPEEDKQYAKEVNYNKEYANYLKAAAREQQERRRDEEDYIDNLAVDSGAIARQGMQGGANAQFTSARRVNQPYNDPNRTARLDAAANRIAQNYNFLGPNNSNNPNFVGPQPNPANTRANLVSQASDIFKAMKPLAPENSKILAVAEKVGPVVLGIAALAKGLQMANEAVADFGKGIVDTTKTILSEKTSGISGTATVLSKSVAIASGDIMGINPYAQGTITAINTIAGVADAIRGYAEQNTEFSPRAMAASIEGDIQKLMQQITLGQKTDLSREAIIKASNKIDLIWEEFKAKFFTTFAPLIITLLETLVFATQAAQTGWNALQGIAGSLLPMPIHLALWAKLLNNTAKDAEKELGLDTAVEKQIADFMSTEAPESLKDLPGFNKNRPNEINF